MKAAEAASVVCPAKARAPSLGTEVEGALAVGAGPPAVPRMRATYRRLKGTEQFLGLYDVHGDCLEGVFRKGKTVVDICEAFACLRKCYPLKRLFVIVER